MTLAENLTIGGGSANGGYAALAGSSGGSPNTSTWDTINFNRQRDLLVRNVPGISDAGDELYSLLSSGLDDAQLLSFANDLTGGAALTDLMDELSHLDDPVARARFNLLHPTQRASLEQFGYAPPEIDNGGDGGFFGSIWGKGARIPGTGLLRRAANLVTPDFDIIGGTDPWGSGDVRTPGGIFALPGLPMHAASEGISYTFKGFEMGERAITHTYRAYAHYAHAGGAGDRNITNPIQGVLDTVVGYSRENAEGNSFMDVWNMTSDGEEYFTEAAKVEAAEILGTSASTMETLNSDLWLARKVAGGHSMDEIARELDITEDDPEWDNTIVTLWQRTHSEAFGEALTILEKGKSSPGRDVARVYGLDDPDHWANTAVESATTTAPFVNALLPDMDAHTLVSGATDATFLILADPTNLVGGAATKVRHATRWSMAADNVRYLSHARATTDAVAAGRQLTRGDALGEILQHIDDVGPVTGVRDGMVGQRMLASRYNTIQRLGNILEVRNAERVLRLHDEISEVMRRHRDALDEAMLRDAGDLEHQAELANSIANEAVGRLQRRRPAMSSVLDSMLQAETLAYHDDLAELGGRLTRAANPDSPYVTHAWDQLIDAARSGRPRSLTTSDGIWDWMVSLEGRRQLIGGQSVGFLPTQPFMPGVSWLNSTVSTPTRNGIRRLFDPGDTRAPWHRVWSEQELGSEWIGKMGNQLQRFMDESAGFFDDGALADDVGFEKFVKDAADPDSGFDELFNFYRETNLGFVSRRLRDAGHENTAKLLNGFIGAPTRAARNFIRSFAYHIPRSRVLHLDRKDAVEEFARAVEMGALGHLPNHLRAEYVGQFARGNKAQRISSALALQADIMVRTGLLGDSSLQASESWLRFVKHARQGYSLGDNGSDATVIEGVQTRNALWTAPTKTSEYSDVIMMADFRELARATRSANMYRAVFGRISDNFLDTAMNRYWKPAQLLRIGFAPRAGGEEAISFLLREGPRSYARAKLATYASPVRIDRSGTIRNADEFHQFALMRPFNWATYQLDYAWGLADNALNNRALNNLMRREGADLAGVDPKTLSDKLGKEIDRLRRDASPVRAGIHGLNNIVERSNLWMGSHLHDLGARIKWFPTKRELSERLIRHRSQRGFSIEHADDDAMVAGFVFSHPLYQRAMHTIAGTTFDPYRNTGNIQSQIMQPIRSGLDNNIRYVPMKVELSDWVDVTRDGDLFQYAHNYSSLLERIVTTPAGRAAVSQQIHYVAPSQAARFANQLDPASLDQIEDLRHLDRTSEDFYRGVHDYIRRHVPRETLDRLHRWVHMGDDISISSALDDIATPGARVLTQDIITSLMGSTMDRSVGISLFSPSIDAGRLVFSQVDSERMIRETLKHSLRQNYGDDALHNSVIATMGEHGEIARGLPDGITRIYTPAIDQRSVHLLAEFLFDDQAIIEFSSDIITRVTAELPAYPNIGTLRGQLEEALVQMGSPDTIGWMSASRNSADNAQIALQTLGSRDPELTRVISNAFDEAIESRRIAMGETGAGYQLPPDTGRMMFHDIPTADLVGDVKPWRIDAAQPGDGRHFDQIQPAVAYHGKTIGDEYTTLHRIETPQGPRWITDDELTATGIHGFNIEDQRVVSTFHSRGGRSANQIDTARADMLDGGDQLAEALDRLARWTAGDGDLAINDLELVFDGLHRNMIDYVQVEIDELAPWIDDMLAGGSDIPEEVATRLQAAADTLAAFEQTRSATQAIVGDALSTWLRENAGTDVSDFSELGVGFRQWIDDFGDEVRDEMGRDPQLAGMLWRHANSRAETQLDEAARFFAISDRGLDLSNTRVLETIQSPGDSLQNGIDILATQQAENIKEYLTSAFSEQAIGSSLLGQQHSYEALTEIGDAALMGDDFLTGAHLTAIGDLSKMASHAHGPRLAIAGDTTWDKMVRFGFDEVTTPLIASIARTPHFMRNVQVAMRQTKFVFDELLDPALNRRLKAVLDEDTTEAVDRMVSMVWDQANELNWEGALDGSYLAGDDMAPLVDVARRIQDVDATPDDLRDAFAKLGVGDAANWSDEAATKMRSAVVDRHHAWAEWQSTTVERALEITVPFIDDHRIRSQWQEWMSSMVPFWFAEEQFLRRYARGFYQTPHQLRRGQLAMNGMREMGTIREDAQGNDVFVYPMSEVVTEVLAPIIALRFGGGSFGQVTGNPITARTEYMFPGLNSDFGQIQWGPLPALALNLTANILPEFEVVRDGLLGDVDANRFDPGSDVLGEILQSFMPAAATDLFTGAVLNRFDEQRLRSAEIQAIQYLAANGHAPEPTASPGEIEEFHKRVDSTARTILIFRSLTGFTAGASGRIETPDLEIREEFRQLLDSHIDLPQALNAFVAEFPDATPYTVFGSRSSSGAPIPATSAALDFMEANTEWIEAFPMVAPWFLPQQEDFDEEFGMHQRRARNWAVANELRLLQTPEEFMEQLYFSEAAEPYFSRQRTYREARESLRLAGDTDAVKELDRMWQTWSSSWKDQHPIFASRMDTPNGDGRREQIVAQAEEILADPGSIPFTPHRNELMSMLRLAVEYSRSNDQLLHDDTAFATEVRNELRVQFYNDAQALVTLTPMLETFFNSVVIPMIGESNLIKLDVRGELEGFVE